MEGCHSLEVPELSREMKRTPLDNFLSAAKEKGASDEFLVQLLKDRGFPVGEVYQALGRR